VLNGTLGTVVAAEDRDLVIETDDGERRTLPERYIADGHLSHAYAFTVHKAQGLTVDVALLLGDDTLFVRSPPLSTSFSPHFVSCRQTRSAVGTRVERRVIDPMAPTSMIRDLRSQISDLRSRIR
jgi:hypothetical protein